MNVSLTPKLEEYVRNKVDSGLYNSSSEVIREALRLLEENDAMREIRLKELRRDISVGIEQADKGRTEPLDIKAIKKESRNRLKQKTAPDNA